MINADDGIHGSHFVSTVLWPLAGLSDCLISLEKKDHNTHSLLTRSSRYTSESNTEDYCQAATFALVTIH